MLRVVGQASRSFCDAVSRRSFLNIGSLAMGGLALPQLLRAEAQAPLTGAPGSKSHKAVIMLTMNSTRNTKILFFVFLVLFIVSLIAGGVRRPLP